MSQPSLSPGIATRLSATLSEMRDERQGAPVIPIGDRSAVAVAVVACNPSSTIPNATLGNSLLVLTLVFVCHCSKDHTMK